EFQGPRPRARGLGRQPARRERYRARFRRQRRPVRRRLRRPRRIGLSCVRALARELRQQGDDQRSWWGYDRRRGTIRGRRGGLFGRTRRSRLVFDELVFDAVSPRREENDALRDRRTTRL